MLLAVTFRDHCHIIGIYHGDAHNACNLNYRITPKSWKLPVVIQNLKGYDGHLIVKALKSEFGRVGVIPQNLEKYLSNSWSIEISRFVSVYPPRCSI